MRLDADVSEATPGTAPAKMLREVVDRLSGDVVDVQTAARTGALRISGGPSEFHLSTVAPETFPRPADMDWDAAVAIPGAALAPMLRAAVTTVSSDDTRSPALRGVLWEAGGEQLSLVSTDGFRLTHVSRTLSEPVPPAKLVIPPRCFAPWPRSSRRATPSRWWPTVPASGSADRVSRS